MFCLIVIIILLSLYLDDKSNTMKISLKIILLFCCFVVVVVLLFFCCFVLCFVVYICCFVLL